MVLKISLIIICLSMPFVVYGSVIINEIAWMGTAVSYSDEWIELKNNKGSEINLEGWILKADDGTPEINLKGTVPANGFCLLERTDDETVPGIPADLIYKGALGNSGENLKLFDISGNLVDEVNCSDGWAAGDNTTKQTMERINSEKWQTSAEPGGTPKKENQELRIMNHEDDEPEKTTEGSPPPTGSVNYPAGIVFNEILPSPEGPDDENEWVEIFNTNDLEINLSEWQIQDTVGKTTNYSLNTKIPALGYLVLSRPETKITLNNSGDGLNLIYPNGEIADSINFGKASLEQSYNRIQSGWSWSTILTPGKQNIVPPPQTEQKPSFTKVSEGKETAAIGEKAQKTLRQYSGSRAVFPLLIAFVIAISSAMVILILKRLNRSRRKSNNN